MYLESFLCIEDLDQETIFDCSHQGSCDEDVAYWREKIDFSVSRDRAIRCLEEYGAWSRQELDAMSDDEIAEIILWVACGDFREFLESQEGGYSPETAPSGSDLFSLE